MPAKTDHLSTPRQRALKVSAGLGGFILAVAIHLTIGALVEDKGPVVITSAYSTFFLWVALMVLAFWFKNGWRAWGVYLLGTALCAGIIYWAL